MLFPTFLLWPERLQLLVMLAYLPATFKEFALNTGSDPLSLRNELDKIHRRFHAVSVNGSEDSGCSWPSGY
ncbi:MAG: hypothetical protein HY318_19310 [Armatimonadetes bacterium]|nr:hypothetical protein [Armatimonadota bacterium]